MSLITIGIPVFNAMPYLKETVQSVLSQTYRDFDLLVINDGSTDDSLGYLESLHDPRLRIINQENRGLSATLNRMLEEVRTPWLARLDADDVAYPHRIARTLEHIERYPGSGMLCSLADYYPRGCYGQFRATVGNPEQFRDLVRSGYLPSICHPTVTLNVERAKCAGGYRFNLYVEDIDLWWRMALQYDIRLIPEVTLGFRQNMKSVSSANLAKQALNATYVQYLLLSHLWKLTPVPYEQACYQLQLLIDPRKLESKARLRDFNIELGCGRRGKALVKLASAFWASPSAFTRRLLDEFPTHRNISLGEEPELFAKYRSALWPDSQTATKFTGAARDAQSLPSPTPVGSRSQFLHSPTLTPSSD
jgi:hypothetical protein